MYLLQILSPWLCLFSHSLDIVLQSEFLILMKFILSIIFFMDLRMFGVVSKIIVITKVIYNFSCVIL